ncbi:OprO/OprP family phosphate-selective porin [Methylogaea oryzae]|uniref:OprO/OprP family phosphate-selective porin n=1 Tax=Methylogaea oryzae TaxID=1295382 RepID=UPI0006D22DED|nr:porin [Methylogaea oryzae]
MLERLEKRVHELEQKLAAQPAAAKDAKQGGGALTSASGDKQALDDLGRKVRVLERKFEVEKEVATDNAKKSPKFEMGSDGLRFTSAEGDHTVRLRGSLQGDAKVFMDDNARNAPSGSNSARGNNIADRFELRQARLWLEGTLWKDIDFKIMQEFGGSTSSLFDAYIDANYLPYAALSVGKQKTPLSLERLQGDADGNFLERAYPTYLASNREVGVMLHGSFAKPGYELEKRSGPVDFKNFVSYQLGVFNGSGDNTSPANVTTDTKDDKEFVGRIFAHPFQHSGVDILDGLGVGIAGSWEQPMNRAVASGTTATAASLVSPIGQNAFLNYANQGARANSGTSTITANGDHYRLYPQAYWYYGPYGLLGEYVDSSQKLLASNGAATAATTVKKTIQQDNHAWQIQASYVLTGEDNTFQSVKPRAPFDPSAGNWGAFQVVGRLSGLTVDKASFSNLGSTNSQFYLLDPTKSIQKANSFAVGLNWFLNKNVRIMTDFERTSFTGGGGTGAGTAASPYRVTDRPSENVWGTRFQLVF